MRNAVICEPLRTPVGGFGGSLRDVPAVDLHGVTFLDSAGLCVLAAAHRRSVRDGIRLRVLASSRAVVRPMQITGLYDLLDVADSENGVA